MGKKRVALLGEEKVRKETKKSLKETKGVRVPGLKGGERVAAVVAEPLPEETPVTTETPAFADLPAGKAGATAGKLKKTKPKKKRGKKYLAARTKVDPTKTYALPEAIKLVKETSFSGFDATVEAHLVTLKPGIQTEVTLPYFQGKTKRVEIASDETLKKLEAGKIDFDILIASPAFMGKLVKYAKVLGPKGLMPNPKNGTITDQPEEAVKKLQKGATSLKTEQNAPLIHTVFGKVSQKEEELEANLATIISTIGPRNIKRAVVCSSMGPGIKIDLSSAWPQQLSSIAPLSEQSTGGSAGPKKKKLSPKL